MTMEFALGRASRKSPVRLYSKLAPEGSKWHLHGYVAMLGNYILMMFYTTVTGWMVQYFVNMARGKFVGEDAAGVAAIFGEMLADPITMTIYMLIVVVAGFAINSIGLQNGVEKVTKVMMLALMVIMVVLAFNSIFMEGGEEGLKFYLLPDFARMKEIGMADVIGGAMSQAFFTLSLGIGSMAIFGSYIGKERALMGESVRVAVLDTFVALASGLIIFPACFAYGVEADSGPSLIFITLPNIFNNIPMGRVWGSLFFIFLTFAAFSTILAVFENILSCTMDLTGWGRKKASLVNGIIISIISIPCILGFNVWSSFQPLGPGSGVLDLEDFVISNLILPLGSLIYVLFCVSRYGWGWDKFIAEANEGAGLKVAKWMRPYMTYVLPIIILILFFMGIL